MTGLWSVSTAEQFANFLTSAKSS